MGGPGSGGANRRTLNEHRFTGTVRRHRHQRATAAQVERKGAAARLEDLRTNYNHARDVLTSLRTGPQNPRTMRETRLFSVLLVALSAAIGREERIAALVPPETADSFAEFDAVLARAEAEKH